MFTFTVYCFILIFTLFLSGTRCHVTVKVDKVAFIEVWVKTHKFLAEDHIPLLLKPGLWDLLANLLVLILRILSMHLQRPKKVFRL